jgi:thiopeptide-type bacteriocin biosynthesis protein
MIENVQRTFVIGDKWLYYKIYCGVKTTDTLLLEVIKPLTEQLIEEKIIDKWFFIRYSDPEPHVRFRVQFIDIKNIGAVIKKMKNLLQPYMNSNQVWDVALATYKRELERYGTNTIEDAELFFYHDSLMILQIIENSKDDETRFLTLFKWLENILLLFKFEDTGLLSFLERIQEQFKEEFSVDKRVRKELSNTYRKLAPALFDKEDTNAPRIYNPTETVERFLMLKKEQKLEVSLDNVVASFIHMSVNRCFRSKQRLYEMMLYDFLYRKNKSKFVRYGRL